MVAFGLKVAGAIIIAVLPVVIIVAILVKLLMDPLRFKRFRGIMKDKPLRRNEVYGFARIHSNGLENNPVITVPQRAHARIGMLPKYSEGETAPLYHDIENDPIILNSY